jgi:hypothetical protein
LIKELRTGVEENTGSLTTGVGKTGYSQVED